MGSVIESVEEWVNKHPDKPLYSFLDQSGEAIVSYSYETFLQRIDVIAGHLRSWRGLKNGDRVLLAYSPGLETICALFACSRAGLIPVPVSPPSAYGFRSALYRMEHIALDCQAVALLTGDDCHDLLRQKVGSNGGAAAPVEAPAIAGLEWIVTEELTEPAGQPADDKPSDIFFLQYTSGSTSSPRGVIVTHDNILHNCGLAVNHEAPVAVSWLPQHHDMGLIGYYIYALLNGGTTYGFSPTTFIQRPALWFETIARYHATASSAPNFAYDYCLRSGRLPQEKLADLDLSSLRYLMAAAEPIKTGTYRQFLKKFERYGLKPESFFVAYGLAENTLAVTSYGRNMISLNKYELARGRARRTRDVAEIDAATHLMSCGAPLGDIRVRIVNPETHVAVSDRETGEIWIAGDSKCRGYWNNPEMTRTLFHARIAGDAGDETDYLRTGDIGFFHDGELYVCGRLKDMIIVRGQNYYPQDIETVVEQASPHMRRNCVVAFEIDQDDEAAVAVVAELTSTRARPDAQAIVSSIRDQLNIEIALIIFVPPKAVPRTTSGKIMRYMTKQMWLAGELKILGQFVRERGVGIAGSSDGSPFGFLKSRCGLRGDEPYSLIEAGLDSVDLVLFMHELKTALAAHGASLLADEIDVSLIQQISIADIFRTVDQFEQAPETAVVEIRQLLQAMQQEQRDAERAMMAKDRAFPYVPATPVSVDIRSPRGSVLLTGGTGFLGPFLLASLIEQTDATINVLVRAKTPEEARTRLRTTMETAGAVPGERLAQLEQRVVPVPGDLEKPDLGLAEDDRARLANEVQTIYHSAAAVNYVFNYGRLRAANVCGTNEVLRLAFEERPKQFNHLSTTFIFGWALKDVLYENDSNDEMELLNFGYSQSKWVSEQLVADAARHGLSTRIFRPSLITPSMSGGGNNFDITIRLLAFMINHGIGVNTLNQVSFVPAEVAANNIVAISNLPDTINGTFHVTRDDYANMMDVTDIISARTGRHFDHFALADFIPEVIRRCTKDDLLFPLLDFLIGSVDRISAMEFKRYDSSSYQKAREMSPCGMADPSLDLTMAGILKFMERTGII